MAEKLSEERIAELERMCSASTGGATGEEGITTSHPLPDTPEMRELVAAASKMIRASDETLWGVYKECPLCHRPASVSRERGLREALTRIAEKGCGIFYGGEKPGWTCLDEMARAAEHPETYSEDYGAIIRRGDRLCDGCRARAALVETGDEGGGA